MFGKHYEARLLEWQAFRNETLSNSSDVITDVIELYQKAPKVSIHTDPYSQQTWPGPWELILENKYCDFCKILGICYTFPVSGKFTDAQLAIYEVVLEAESKAIAAVSVNNNVMDAQIISEKVVTQGLIDLGILKGSLDDLHAKGAFKEFYRRDNVKRNTNRQT